MTPTKAVSIALLLLLATPLCAQEAPPPEAESEPAPAKKVVDKSAPNPKDPELPWPADLVIPPADPISPEEELKSFQLAPGFKAELVAAEPMVEEPVTISFDARGRMWVVEMRGYMPNVDAKGEDEPNGRVVILEDTNGDGRMDKRTVFLDGLVMPRAIMLRKNGAVVAIPPALYWCPDANDDGVADEKIVIHPNYCGTSNPEHLPNGLLLAMDNWIYNAKSSERFRFNQAGEFIKDRTFFRGQWGIAQDDWGRLYYNYNSDQLRADLLSSEYTGRNPNFRFVEGVNAQIAKDQRVYPIRVTPGVNRAYRKGMLKDGKLYEFTGASGPVVYRGDLFPEEYRGNSFVPEPVANLIKRNVHAERDGDILAKQAWKDREFLASDHERFRPVNLFNAPDGALYVVDMYRGIIQHLTYVSPWLRRQILTRGLEKPIHQGRIWRIVPDKTTGATKRPLLASLKPAELVAELESANGWRRDTAQRLLVESGDAALVPALQKLLTSSKSPLARLHALWTLEGLEKLDAATATAALRDAEPKVRAAALHLCERFMKTAPAVLAEIKAMAKDPAAEVQVQLLCTLGELGRDAEPLMAEVLLKAGENRLARTAAISGLRGRELEFLEALLASPAWAEASPGRENLIAHLARCVLEEKKPERIAKLLEIAAAGGRIVWQERAVLNGLAGSIPVPKVAPELTAAPIPSLDGKKKAPPMQGGYGKGFKVKLDAEPPALAKLTGSKDKEIKSRAEKLLGVLTWPGKAGEAAPAPLPPLTEPQKLAIEQGKALYALCGACHQPNGQGQEGLAPPLANSEWVTGSEQRLIKIILQGIGGPIEVNGRQYNLDMPGLAAALGDEQIAQIASYIRREWGNQASYVDTATVTAVREGTKDRGGSWTAEELANAH